MAPREVEKRKVTPKVQVQLSAAKSIATRSSPAAKVKKALANKKVMEKVPLKMNTTVETRQRTSTVPKVSSPKSPKPKENKSVPLPGSVTKSAKKPSWKRRPKPAHSGVPVPEKMKQLVHKQFLDLDDSL